MKTIVASLLIIISICFSISCEKPIIPDNVLIDIDGNVYKTIQIGSQEWMTSDLKTIHYNDGKLIPNKTIKDTSSVQLYTFYIVESDKLCPMNWHVPKSYEWEELNSHIKNLNFNILGLGYWWSSSNLVEGYESPQARAWYINQTINLPEEFITLKEQYLSVRCVKN